MPQHNLITTKRNYQFNHGCLDNVNHIIRKDTTTSIHNFTIRHGNNITSSELSTISRPSNMSQSHPVI